MVGVALSLQEGGGAVAINIFAAPSLGVTELVPAMMVVMAGSAMTLPNSLTLALEHHAAEAGVATGVLGLFQYSLAACIPPLVGLAGGYGNGIPVGVTVLTGGAIGMIAYLTLSRPRQDLRAEGGEPVNVSVNEFAAT
jgi:DHA1 family bicyclomycin/chloramphenicol resistance-like MFS transporter